MAAPYFESLRCSCRQERQLCRSRPRCRRAKRALELAVAALSRLGQTDLAFQAAERPKSQFSRTKLWLLFGPSTAPLRGDPRFMDLAARVGLAEQWRTTDRWPDYCAEPGLPYDCRAEAARAVAQLKKL